jgi:HAD superfamily hydrolase (TIGR01509 family)
MLRAVLFDVGGPLDTEVEHERRVEAAIRAALPVSDAEYAAAVQAAVASFAPDAYAAIIWRLTCFDVAAAQQVRATVARASAAREAIQLRPGIQSLLADLKARGLLLGVVANQPRRVESMLDAAGIGHFFDHLGISESVGLRKPDVRLFLQVCEALGVRPAECLMVGDRIDNDVVPARTLGMRTVLLRSGFHKDQRPRTWQEVPDFEVGDVHGMRAAIESAIAP